MLLYRILVLTLVISSFTYLTTAAPDDDYCESYPNFDRTYWEDLLPDCDLQQANDHGSPGNYGLRVDLPRTLEKYLERDSDRCVEHRFVQTKKVHKFKFWIRFDKEDFRGDDFIECKYDTIRDLPGLTTDKCDNPHRIYNNINTCGMNTVRLYGQHNNSEQKYYLGMRIVQFPIYTRLVQTAKSLNSATLKFDPRMNTCWQNRSYDVQCGTLRHTLKEDGELTIDNLLPGQIGSCLYKNQGMNLTVSVSFAAEVLDFESASAFTAHDNGIFLMEDFAAKLKGNSSSVNITMTVTDTKTKEEYTVSGDYAVKSGVTNLAPLRSYSVCLNLTQLDGPYGQDRRSWCRSVSTLPPLMFKGISLTCNLVILLGIVIAVVLAAVLVFCFWRNAGALRRLCCKFKNEENEQQLPIHEKK